MATASKIWMIETKTRTKKRFRWKRSGGSRYVHAGDWSDGHQEMGTKRQAFGERDVSLV